MSVLSPVLQCVVLAALSVARAVTYFDHYDLCQNFDQSSLLILIVLQIRMVRIDCDQM